MKRLSIIISIATALICCACNRDVFVNPICKSGQIITIGDLGDTIVLKFGIDQWDVISVKSNYRSLTGSVHDDLGAANATDLRLIGNGTMQCVTENLFIKATRDKAKELTVIVGPNFSKKENEFSMELSNNFETDTLYFRQRPGKEFEITGVSWANTPEYSMTEIDDSHSYYIFNNTFLDKPYDYAYNVFEHAKRQVFFTDDYGLSERSAFNLTIPIPDGLTNDDKEIVDSDETAPYRADCQDLPVKLSVIRHLTLQPGESVTETPFWFMERMEVKYTLHLQSKESGKIIPVNGIMTSRAPTGEYFIKYLQDSAEGKQLL